MRRCRRAAAQWERTPRATGSACCRGATAYQGQGLRSRTRFAVTELTGVPFRRGFLARSPEHRVLRRRVRPNAILIETLLDSAPELARDFPLLEWKRLHLHAHVDAGFTEALDAEHLGRLE